MKALRRTGLILLALLLLAAAASAWLVGTAPGARLALKLARSRLPGQLIVGRVDGSLVGPLVLEKVEYRGTGDGTALTLGRVELDVAAPELLRGKLHVVRASVDAVRVVLPAAVRQEPGAPQLLLAPLQLPNLQPRWPIHVDRFTATDLRVERGDEVLLEVAQLESAGRWNASELALERLELSGPQGAADLRFRLAAASAPRLEAAGQFRWAIRGTTYAGKLDSRTEGDRLVLETSLSMPFAGSGRAELLPADVPRWTLEIDIPEFDPRGTLVPRAAALARVGGQIRAQGDARRASFAGTITANGEKIRVESLDATLAPDALRIESLLVRINDTPGTIRADGHVRLAAGAPEFDLNLAVDRFVVPAAWAQRELHATGAFRAEGNPSAYTAEGTLAVGPAGRPSQLEFSLRGDPRGLRLEPLRVRQPEGRLDARGELAFKPLRWDVTASAENFDPGEFVPTWPGRLTGEIRSQGEVETDGPHLEVSVSRLAGKLKEREIVGEGELSYTPAGWIQGDLHFEAGEARVRVRTTPGQVPEAHIDFALPSLQAWVPGASGALRATAVVRGKWPNVGITGEASGEELSFGNWRVGRLQLSADLADVRRPSGRLRANLDRAAVGRFELERLKIEGAGDESTHELTLRTEGEPLQANLKLTGAMSGERWKGVLQELRLAWSRLPELELRAPATIEAGRDGSFLLSGAELAGGGIRLAVGGSRSVAREWAAEIGLEQLPLSLLDELAPGALPARLEGHLSAQAKLRRAGDDPWTGEARINSPSARAILSDGAKTAGAPADLLLYENLEIEAVLEGRSGRAKVLTGLAAKGHLAAELSFADFGAADASLGGTVDATLPTLEPIATFVPQVPGLEGRIEAKLQLAGKIRAPEVAGQIDASGLKAEMPRLGLRLREGRLRLEPGAGRELKLSGSIKSGEGHVDLVGGWTPGGSGRATLKGERFLAADLPAARVIVAPDLAVTYEREGFGVKGKALITEAAINLQQLPQGRAPGHSRDVVVVDRPEESQRRGMLPLEAQVTVELGDKVQVTGFGLEAQLRGRVNVMEKAGAPTSASGEVLVTGTYEGYGQDLEITRGRVLYAGTPLNDPRLDISAERELQEITAGVRISGTGQAPEIHVFSRPDLGQADALSYLVTGKPLSGVASEGESDQLDSAARSLGTVAGSLVAERIGRRLGIDEIGIENSDMIDGGVFTIGQYLSPRLYVAYGVGLFEPGDLVTLRYELTKALNLRAVRGPDETRAGVEYKIER